MATEPQWLRLGRAAAARALYEAWHPLRTDNGNPDGSIAWDDLMAEARARYEAAGEAACRAFHASTLDSATRDVEALIASGPEEEDGNVRR